MLQADQTISNAFDVPDCVLVAVLWNDHLDFQGHNVRVRQHVNPLKKELQVAHPPPDWHAMLDDPTLPLMVDVGCGYGRFPLKYAMARPSENVLGLEIRSPLVKRASLCALNSSFIMIACGQHMTVIKYTHMEYSHAALQVRLTLAASM